MCNALFRAVSRAIIDNDLLPMRVRLIENAAQAALNVAFEVVNGGDDGNERLVDPWLRGQLGYSGRLLVQVI